MAPYSSTLAWKINGWRNLVGCSPWGLKESDMTEWLHFHFSLSHIGEGNGNPLQCSCLENPRDGGAWWAAVYGVAQSRTQLKRLSSSSSTCWELTPCPSLHWELGTPGEGVDPVHKAHPLNLEGQTVHSGFTSSGAENNLGTEKSKSPPLPTINKGLAYSC